MRNRLLLALYLGSLLGLLVIALGDSEQRTVLGRGDFSGFYAAGAIVASGSAESLYDPREQARFQREGWGSQRSDFYLFAYPPYTAVLLAPWGFLAPFQAKVLSVLFLFGCSLLALGYARSWAPALSGWSWGALGLLSIWWLPLSVGALIGQNTALTCLLISAALHHALRNTSRDDLIAGVLAGLCLYKPQFGAFLCAYFLLLRRRSIFIGMLSAAVIYYLLGASILGFLWPNEWYRALAAFGHWNLNANSYLMFSIFPTYHNLLSLAETGQVGIVALGVLFSTLGVATALLPLKLLWLHEPDQRRVVAGLCLGCVATALLAPQTLFYDFGIVALAAIATFRFTEISGRTLTLGFLVVSSVAMLAYEAYPISPLFWLSLVTSVLLLKSARLKANCR